MKTIHDRFGPQAGLARLTTREFWDSQPPPPEKIESLKSYIPDFEILPSSEFPDKTKTKFGVTYTTFNFNCPKFIKFLKDYVQAQGATFIKKKIQHIEEAFLEFAESETQNKVSIEAVFNCTGLGAQTLGGVNDKNVYPTRGQVVVVRVPHINENRSTWSPEYATYVIPRPYSYVNSAPDVSEGNSDVLSAATSTTGKTGNVGHVVLGGYLQADNYSGDTNAHETFSILDRTTALYPELLRDPLTGRKKSLSELEIVREAAGLRPSRKGGVRIELEEYYGESSSSASSSSSTQKKIIIHNYGAGGTGYQSGLGMSMEAVALYNDYIKKQKKIKANL